MSVIREAQSGQTEAQLALGKIYLSGGSGLKQDSNTAFYWLRKAAHGGSMEAQQLMHSGGSSNAAGEGNHDANEATGDDSPAADLAFSDWVLTGQISPTNGLSVLEALRRAANAGERRAQLRLGILLQTSGNAADSDEAIHWLECAARLGSRAAAVRLADWCWDRFDPACGAWLEKIGQCGEQDFLYRVGISRATLGAYADAAAPIAKAALLGNPAALLYFGLLHTLPLGKRTTGVAKSLKKAAFWLEKASRGGSGQASFELFRLYRLRQFSLKNVALAQRYLEAAAGQGHAQAQYLLALACLRDSVGHESDVAAARWLLAAARQGHAAAASVARLLYARYPDPPPSIALEQMRVARILARTRIALAARLEVASAFRLTIPELLMFDPQEADRVEFLVLDMRGHTRQAKRRIVTVDSAEERSLLDRARRLLSTANPHPTDVRGSIAQRRLDLQQSLRLLGAELADMGWGA